MPAPQHRVYAIFFLFSFGFGTALARIADIQEHLQIGEGLLGLALMSSSFGLLLFLTFGAPLVDRLGTKRIFLLGNTFMVIFYALVAAFNQYVLVVVAMFFAGIAVGAMEISINVEADRTEAHIGRRIMSRCHGFWSFGFCVAAIFSALMRQFDVPTFTHLSLVVPLVILGTLGMSHRFIPAPAKPGEQSQHGTIFVRPSAYILALCAVCVGALLAEGVGIDWSVIYMRDSFEVSRFIESTSLIAFTFIMALTRFFGDPLVEKIGAVPVARLCLLITILGAIIVGTTTSFMLAIIGFMLLGMGSSIIYPLAVSAAARNTDRPASVNVAALAQTAFFIFFVGPACLGFLAEHFGIRITLIAPIPFAILGLIFVTTLQENRFSARAQPHDHTA